VQKNGEVIKSYTYGDASWKDLLTAFNGQSITYDAIGNPLSYRGMTLSWAGGRRLASVSKEGLSASYVYNTDGIRTQKTVNGVTTNYYLDGNSILRQVTGNDVLEFFYDANGVLGFYYNNTPYYYLKNLQGDIVGILDANGTQVVSYTYDAWGAPLSVTGTAADTIGQLNPFRYRSYYYDNETGLYYLNSRYYDPETCRFISVDGIYDTNTGLLSHNMFAYCNNNPVNMVDNTGMISVLLIVAGIVGTAIVGGLIMRKKATIQDYIEGMAGSTNPILGALFKIKSANENIEGAKQAVQSYSRDVVNANYYYDNPKAFSASSFNKSIIPNETDYIQRCFKKAPTLQQHTELNCQFSIEGKMWDDLTEEQQEEIVNQIGSWDQETAQAIGVYYGVDTAIALFS